MDFPLLAGVLGVEPPPATLRALLLGVVGDRNISESEVESGAGWSVMTMGSRLAGLSLFLLGLNLIPKLTSESSLMMVA